MERLDRFDDVFTDVLIGFALALAAAILIIPRQSLNWEYGARLRLSSIDLETDTADTERPLKLIIGGHDTIPIPDASILVTKERQLEGRSVRAQYRDGHTRQVTGVRVPNTHSGPERYDASAFRVTGKGDSPNLPFRRWLLLLGVALWLVKYIQERSVLKYRINALKKKADFNCGPWSHFCLFFSRVLFLGSTYALIARAFIDEMGHFERLDTIMFIFFLAFGYILPDFALKQASKGLSKDKSAGASEKPATEPQKDRSPDTLLNRALEKWAKLDVVSLVIIAAAFVIGIVAGDWGTERFDSIAAFALAALIVVNTVGDWVWNHHFYFGDSEQGQTSALPTQATS